MAGRSVAGSCGLEGPTLAALLFLGPEAEDLDELLVHRHHLVVAHEGLLLRLAVVIGVALGRAVDLENLGDPLSQLGIDLGLGVLLVEARVLAVVRVLVIFVILRIVVVHLLVRADRLALIVVVTGRDWARLELLRK
jgi:hypothetical protein